VLVNSAIVYFVTIKDLIYLHPYGLTCNIGSSNFYRLEVNVEPSIVLAKVYDLLTFS
jgi:hypothetical protein